MKELVGTGVALVTPFKEDLSVDVTALQNIVEYNIANGVNYLVVLGTTGEPATLTAEEKQLVINTVVKVNAGRLPLVLGIGGNNTMAVVAELKERDLSNFSAILSVSPYYNKPTQEGIYQHFKAIALASPKPIIVYNVPGRTGSNMLPSTTVRLAKDFDNIVAIKEACGDMVQILSIIKNKPKDFMVISGDDFTALSTVLAGGSGVISVIGQGIPAEFSKVISLGLENNAADAHALYNTLHDGIDFIFREGNPAGIKAIFENLNLATAKVRLPLLEATPELKATIQTFMNSFNKQLV
ncbi:MULTISPECIES: 4-hydroxy-tetrahydrodipicolinate synthase [Cellulophaga]|uniref:4-hydroxy-tetrahydrodipicolinate synthase n=2 Tax=Cellulophaga TaxID=104264 RepID=F0RF94_CELLC|nr:MULTISPECIES: 4-hydroxy-tetrahydrodipicolinate synthase [Cellulophaga]ADY31110.1 Dihydrodipicolinate synthase [Cellulophaga lytica DSM 7489]AIM62072.1 dihydrodipicolinate synthase [Cellulophaga lytica]APU11948.1 4-hydroxy-tetrahydrodipicolinate synthase [Cellulophaga lytica]EWH13510.1 dihydrodipicolinate synthase [Cellulophaga geojensis KL-A]MDO6852977.1 4-hydroxy-tetrahydrodipicolinate synthase [Cellulophaga lytica]